ncbi:UPF0329 protein ECU05_1680/ECU11_0050-like [Lingula anatina]|uniref:UPF0329 protein ECU05_1680/ECU11_0050-like n=1 Tax=Lingula anatina TaxID=7574 RepID=A0A1S3HRC6_LINAN|nr:UPF0329 protein ECU05_1680/ECU11_0050-like [Lingula anatina]|eukprot:XP_013388587.1 UPF0329 protein ECU05_1680/ECU11_0050-like [Lingula anatina]
MDGKVRGELVDRVLVQRKVEKQKEKQRKKEEKEMEKERKKEEKERKEEEKKKAKMEKKGKTYVPKPKKEKKEKKRKPVKILDINTKFPEPDGETAEPSDLLPVAELNPSLSSESVLSKGAIAAALSGSGLGATASTEVNYGDVEVWDDWNEQKLQELIMEDLVLQQVLASGGKGKGKGKSSKRKAEEE